MSRGLADTSLFIDGVPVVTQDDDVPAVEGLDVVRV